MRSIGPVDRADVDLKSLGDRAEITLIVDGVGGSESAVDIEYRELVLGSAFSHTTGFQRGS
jgi:hypothetical protein